MSKVEFQEQQYTSRNKGSRNKPSKIMRLAMKLPGVNNVATANIALLIIAILAFAISAYVLMNTYGGTNEPTGGAGVPFEELSEEERAVLPPDVREEIERQTQGGN